MTLGTAFQRIVNPGLLGHVIEQLGPIKRQRGVVLDREVHVQVAGVTMQILPRVDGRLGRQLLRMDVIAATAEIVVTVPVDVGRQHRDVVLGFRGSHDPRKREELTGNRPRVKVIQPRTLRADQVLPVVRIVAVSLVIETNARPGVISVGSDLGGGQRAVFVVPPHRADRFLLPAITEQVESIRFGRVNPVLGFFARADALGPHVTDQRGAQQPELDRVVNRQGDRGPLGREPITTKRHAIVPGRQIRSHRTIGQRPNLQGIRIGRFEQDSHIVQRNESFIADITNQHLGHPQT